MRVIVVLLVLTSFKSFAQVERTTEGYLFRNPDDLIELDFLARQGKICASQLDENISMVEQIRMAKMLTDSICIRLQKNINEVQAGYSVISSDLQDCTRENGILNDTNAELKKEIRRQKMKRFWDWFKLGGAGLAAGFVIGIIK